MQERLTGKKDKIYPKKLKKKIEFGKNAVIFLAFFCLYCFVNVWQSVKITYLNRQNELLRNELLELENQCSELTYELEQLGKIDRILAQVDGKLKLVPAEKINLVQDRY